MCVQAGNHVTPEQFKLARAEALSTGETVEELARRLNVCLFHLWEQVGMAQPQMTPRQRTHYKCLQRAALNKTTAAWRSGKIPHLSKQEIMCVDCNIRRATVYDHRDYSKPLEVAAVCQRCNRWRGPAKIPA